MTKEEKIARATQLRDAAIAIVRSKGSFQPVQHHGREIASVLTCNEGILTIIYTTPFQSLPKGPPKIPAHWSEADKHQAAMMIASDPGE
jgi:hypothetical protein